MSSKKSSYKPFGDGNSERINVGDESSSNDEENEPNGYDGNIKHKTKESRIETFEIVDHGDIEHYQNASSHGEPRRLIHIWLRVMVISLYLVYSIAAIYVMANNEISDGLIDSVIFITIILPTLLLCVIFLKPKCMPYTSCILLIIVIILRTIQWIAAIIFAINDNIHFTDYLFAILGCLINECVFFCYVLMDFYVFYVKKDYDDAIFSVHYNPHKTVRLLSILLFTSSILWFIYCYGALGDQTQYIDTWLYLILAIINASFIIFEYALQPKWGNKFGFVLCCIIMLLILFIWGDDQLLSFSDIATASILPQLMCLSFAYFKQFAAECM